ncbi:thiol-disulfide isomerase/thioredoxin [Pedobacter africanus]|uniref:Thiol-disulfide isomerase/thioredoxin n=1 Tax=Pedobacter africanus TaxID=151894 RepID=A0ACC6KVY6_9SPHI|nr:thioredoxin family protein [Pedobacter africanus]MDR6783315.1 thiol-disulfide isomerase/thioredoxin [Pedobacter africanus]
MKFIQKTLVAPLFILICMVGVLNAQPRFSGTLRSLQNGKSSFDSVVISFFRPNCPEGVVGQAIRLRTDKDGNFSFQLPKYEGISRMVFWTRYKQKTVNGTGFLHYMVEPEDQIKIDIIRNDSTQHAELAFSGYGAEKYNIAYQLEKIAPSRGPFGTYRKTINKDIVLDKPENFAHKLLQLEKLTIETAQAKTDLIQQSGLSKKIKKMLTYNYGAIYHEWTWRMNDYRAKYSKQNPEVSELIKASFLKNKQRFSYPFDPLMANCPNYLATVAVDEARNLYLTNGKVDLPALYKVFESKYSGLTRELLIANMALKKIGFVREMAIDNHVIDSLLVAYEKYITKPFIKEAYTTKVRLLAGTPIFNGVFKDISGSEVAMASLKGKVLFIDMWFTGCGACMEFHKIFHKQVYPVFKENKDFLCISLCIDKNNSQWLNSVKSGKYTSQEYLNLNSTLGVDHPFFKHYGISGFPFLILLDKNGKIYASNINPKPDAIITLINKALML